MSEGRATIWKDTEGRLRLDYTDPAGKRKRERLPHGTSRAQARAILLQRVGKVMDAKILGLPSVEAVKPMLFSEFLEREYLPHCQATHTPATYHNDKSLANVVSPLFGKKPLRAITKGDVLKFIDQEAGRIARPARPLKIGRRIVLGQDGKPVMLPAEKAKPATVNRRFMFVSGVLTEAERRGYIPHNPASKLSQLPEHNDKLRWLAEDEEARLLESAALFLRPIIRLALHTGARKGEILGLRWADIDMEQWLVRFAQTKNHRTRYVPINSALAEVLKSLKGSKRPEFVFTSPGTGTRYKNIDTSFQTAVRLAELRGVTFHTLRHTAASRMVQRGVPLNTVREILGHGSMQVTMRYAHLAPGNLRDAIEVLARAENPADLGTPVARGVGENQEPL